MSAGTRREEAGAMSSRMCLLAPLALGLALSGCYDSSGRDPGADAAPIRVDAGTYRVLIEGVGIEGRIEVGTGAPPDEVCFGEVEI